MVQHDFRERVFLRHATSGRGVMAWPMPVLVRLSGSLSLRWRLFDVKAWLGATGLRVRCRRATSGARHLAWLERRPLGREIQEAYEWARLRMAPASLEAYDYGVLSAR